MRPHSSQLCSNVCYLFRTKEPLKDVLVRRKMESQIPQFQFLSENIPTPMNELKTNFMCFPEQPTPLHNVTTGKLNAVAIDKMGRDLLKIMSKIITIVEFPPKRFLKLPGDSEADQDQFATVENLMKHLEACVTIVNSFKKEESSYNPSNSQNAEEECMGPSAQTLPSSTFSIPPTIESDPVNETLHQCSPTGLENFTSTSNVAGTQSHSSESGDWRSLSPSLLSWSAVPGMDAPGQDYFPDNIGTNDDVKLEIIPFGGLCLSSLMNHSTTNIINSDKKLPPLVILVTPTQIIMAMDPELLVRIEDIEEELILRNGFGEPHTSALVGLTISNQLIYGTEVEVELLQESPGSKLLQHWRLSDYFCGSHVGHSSMGDIIKVTKGKRGTYVPVSATTLLGFLLEKLKNTVERRKGGLCSTAKIIVPDWMSLGCRKGEILDAGKVAGFTEVSVVSQMSLVARHYLFGEMDDSDNGKDNHLLVLSEFCENVDAAVYSWNRDAGTVSILANYSSVLLGKEGLPDADNSNSTSIPQKFFGRLKSLVSTLFPPSKEDIVKKERISLADTVCYHLLENLANSTKNDKLVENGKCNMDVVILTESPEWIEILTMIHCKHNLSRRTPLVISSLNGDREECKVRHILSAAVFDTNPSSQLSPGIFPKPMIVRKTHNLDQSQTLEVVAPAAPTLPQPSASEMVGAAPTRNNPPTECKEENGSNIQDDGNDDQDRDNLRTKCERMKQKVESGSVSFPSKFLKTLALQLIDDAKMTADDCTTRGDDIKDQIIMLDALAVEHNFNYGVDCVQKVYVYIEFIPNFQYFHLIKYSYVISMFAIFVLNHVACCCVNASCLVMFQVEHIT